MPRLKRIKRRILRQAVRENRDLIEGRLPRRYRKRSGYIFSSARLFFMVALPVSLFASSLVIAKAADVWLEAGRAPQVNLQALRKALRPAAVPAAAATSTETELIVGSAEAIDPRVFPLEVKKVVLDPGHGGGNLGTVAYGGLIEKDFTLDIAERLRALLEESAYQVQMTRVADETVSLEDRARIANEAEGDIFISIHLNWLETRQVRGVETYYLGPTDDPYLTELAAKENQGSGYSMADLRGLIEQVYTRARHGESHRLASEVQRALLRSLRTTAPDLQDRGVKTAPFGVLIRTEMPAILAEVSCLSNEQEALLLKSPDHRQFIAEALFSGIRSYSGEVEPTNHLGS